MIFACRKITWITVWGPLGNKKAPQCRNPVHTVAAVIVWPSRLLFSGNLDSAVRNTRFLVYIFGFAHDFNLLKVSELVQSLVSA